MCFFPLSFDFKRLIAFFFRTKHYQLCDLYTISFSKDGNVSAGLVIKLLFIVLQEEAAVYSTIERYNYVNGVRNNYPIAGSLRCGLYSA